MFAFTENDLQVAKNAFRDGFLEVTRQKLSELVYETNVDTLTTEVTPVIVCTPEVNKTVEARAS